MSPGDKGALAELVASSWALRLGHQVFRNVSPHGFGDLVLVDERGNACVVDVKAASVHPTNGRTYAGKLSAKQRNLGVRRLCVLPCGGCFLDDGDDCNVSRPA